MVIESSIRKLTLDEFSLEVFFLFRICTFIKIILNEIIRKIFLSLKKYNLISISSTILMKMVVNRKYLKHRKTLDESRKIHHQQFYMYPKKSHRTSTCTCTYTTEEKEQPHHLLFKIPFNEINEKYARL